MLMGLAAIFDYNTVCNFTVDLSLSSISMQLADTDSELFVHTCLIVFGICISQCQCRLT